MIDWMYKTGNMTPEQKALYEQLGYHDVAPVVVEDAPEELVNTNSNPAPVVNPAGTNAELIADPAEEIDPNAPQAWTVTNTGGRWISNPGSRIMYQGTPVGGFGYGMPSNNGVNVGNGNANNRVPKWLQKTGNYLSSIGNNPRIDPEYVQDRRDKFDPIRQEIRDTNQQIRNTRIS